MKPAPHLSWVWRLVRRCKPRPWARLCYRLRLLPVAQRPKVEQVLAQNSALAWHNLRAHFGTIELHDPQGLLLWIQAHPKTVCVGIHQGLWEALPLWLAQNNCRVCSPWASPMGRKSNTIWDRMLQKLVARILRYERNRLRYFHLNDLKQEFRQLVQNSRETVCLLVDQGPGDTAIELFNQPTRWNFGLVKHLRKYGYNVVLFSILPKMETIPNAKQSPQWEIQGRILSNEEALAVDGVRWFENQLFKHPTYWIWHYPTQWPKIRAFLRKKNARDAGIEFTQN